MIELFEHQKEALEKTKDFENVAYFYDMGLGKTFIGSEKMMIYGNDINLVICQKSKIDDWIKHFKNNYRANEVYNLTDKKEYDYFFKNIGKYSMIGVINYELAWRRKELESLKDFTLMLDESSSIQNSKAKQSKFITRKLKPKNTILLSGTPTSGKYERLWTQCHLLGWDISESRYNNTFVNWDLIDFGMGKVRVLNKKNPYKNVERLKKKLREYGAVFMKTEECFKLPSQIFIDVKIKMPKEYLQFLETSIVTIESKELVGDTSLTKRLYLRMLSSQYNSEKIKAFKDLIESTEDRLIVFYNFNEELEKLKKVTDRPISIVNGHQKDLTNYENENDSVTFIQYQAGAMGLNLQKANKIIYFSPTERCELYMQSKKRINRIGQERPCFYYKMTTEGSVEELIYEALDRGEDFTDELFKERIVQ